jgi:EmrB/QacA subfamily drug resistance transporter
MKWRPLMVLAAAQFLMVIDTSVMNVSISQLVEDFDTEVTTIQGVITFFSLVMAALMITGGKLGDRLGRRRAFGIGLAIYGTGSFVTAISPTVPVLVLGWSVLEGVGAALVLPALAALVAGNYRDEDRAVAYGVIGGVAGAAVAVGPIIGGWVTTNLSWRIVFGAEVLVVIAILVTIRFIAEVPSDQRPHIDVPGAVLSGAGLALIVFGVLQSSSWGWVEPRDVPFEVLGFSPTLFVIAAGGGLLWAFSAWQHHVEDRGGDPLIHMRLFRVASLRAGLVTNTGQQVVLLGLFFTIPLYLQIVIGLDAFETGIRLLPVSATLLVFSLAGARSSKRFGPRLLVRVGLVLVFAGAVLLLGTIDPELDGTAFAVSMAVLGAGMGLVVSQLGNVVQSAVGEDDRSEVGGLQYTAQNLGGSLGTALIGSIVVGALSSLLLTGILADPDITDEVKAQASGSLTSSVPFVPSDEVRAASTAAGLPPDQVDEVVENYAEAALEALRSGVLVAAGISLLVLFGTRALPRRPLGGDDDGDPEAEPEPAAHAAHAADAADAADAPAGDGTSSG